MTTYPITFVEHPTGQDYQAIFDGINAFATSLGLDSTKGSYFFAVYDEAKIIKAAISGFDNFGTAEIGGLWVHESLRNKGYGRALVQKAVDWASSKGCNALTVFTLKQWPAFTWYQSLGFTLEFERPGHSNNLTGCYLIKWL